MSAWGQGYRDKGSDYNRGRGRSYDSNRGRNYNSRGRGGRNNQSYGYRDNYERQNQGYYNNQNSYRSNYERQNQGYGNQRGGYNNDRYERNYSSNYSRGRGSYSNNYNNNNNYNNQRGGYGGNTSSNIWGQKAKKDQQNHGYNNQTQPNLNVNSSRVIIDDLNPPERPSYILSCYGHQRDLGNDVNGDFSFEELRWLVKSATQQGVADQQRMQQIINRAVQEKEKAFGILRRQGNHPPSVGGPAIITRDIQSILAEVFQPPSRSFQSGAIHAPTIAPIPEEIEMQEPTPIQNTPLDISMFSANSQQTKAPPQPQANFIQMQVNGNNSSTTNQLPSQSSLSQVSVSTGNAQSLSYENCIDVWKLAKFELGMIPEEPPPPEVCR